MDNLQLRIAASDLYERFRGILIKEGFPAEKAEVCARVFTDNSLDGVYSHGVNRFPRFVGAVRKGIVKPAAEPTPVTQQAALEQWEGNGGPGMINALIATRRSMALADQYGLGCVGLRFTNHWMRGGTYGQVAAGSGYAFVSWSNTLANMPAWGGIDPRLGNNPLVMAVPHEQGPVVLDMAMSQYSYGALDHARSGKKTLDVPGGFDASGNLSDDPAEILSAKRILPMGYWKGSGLSLLLDLLATLLSNGFSVAEVTRQGEEHNLSQVFISIALNNPSPVAAQVQRIIDDYHETTPVKGGAPVRYPGERIVSTRRENEQLGVPVARSVWNQILQL